MGIWYQTLGTYLFVEGQEGILFLWGFLVFVCCLFGFFKISANSTAFLKNELYNMHVMGLYFV